MRVRIIEVLLYTKQYYFTLCIIFATIEKVQNYFFNKKIMFFPYSLFKKNFKVLKTGKSTKHLFQIFAKICNDLCYTGDILL